MCACDVGCRGDRAVIREGGILYLLVPSICAGRIRGTWKEDADICGALR
jgi:hypothetical protein